MPDAYAAALLARVRSRRLAFDAFAWKQGRRGGRYWLPDDRPDQPAFRLYGAKADKAAAAQQGKGKEMGARAPISGGGRAGQELALARAKAAVAADAVREAQAGGVPPDRLAWLQARAAKAAADLKAMSPKVNKPARPAARPAARPKPTPVGSVLAGDLKQLRASYGKAAAGHDDATLIHNTLRQMTADEWAAATKAYGMGGTPHSQTARNKLYGKVMARATGDRLHDYDTWTREDYAALYTPPPRR